jgi:hypothetical protein
MIAATTRPTSSAHIKGLSRNDKARSKAQQRLLWARGFPYARSASKSGAAYKAMPTHVEAHKR